MKKDLVDHALDIGLGTTAIGRNAIKDVGTNSLFGNTGTKCPCCREGTLHVLNTVSPDKLQSIVDDLEDGLGRPVDDISESTILVKSDEYDSVLNIFDWDEFEDSEPVNIEEIDGYRYIHLADKKTVTCTRCSLKLKFGIDQDALSMLNEDDSHAKGNWGSISTQAKKKAINSHYGRSALEGRESFDGWGDVDFEPNISYGDTPSYELEVYSDDSYGEGFIKGPKDDDLADRFRKFMKIEEPSQ